MQILLVRLMDNKLARSRNINHGPMRYTSVLWMLPVMNVATVMNEAKKHGPSGPVLVVVDVNNLKNGRK